MKTPFVNELEVNKPITAAFLVQSKEIREKKTGEPYLSLLLSDRTGKVDAKMWDNVTEVMDKFERDDFVKVKALLQIHMNRPQLTIHKIRVMEDAEVDFGDFFPASARNPDEMWKELREITGELANPHLKALLNSLLDDAEIARKYRLAPAAKTIHHAFLGGLLEHVLSLCNLCRMAATHYRHIDLDLMITGAVLHDIGKIHELSYERGFNYTSDGQLLGHMMIALRMVGDKIVGIPGFPPPLRTLVEHMIISHHGHLEYGSPKLPQFPEALLLHHLDDMDSKMECMRALIDGDRQSEGCFTGYNAALERMVLKKARYLEAPAVPEKKAAAEKSPAKASHPAPAPSSSPFGEKLQLALVGPEAKPSHSED